MSLSRNPLSDGLLEVARHLTELRGRRRIVEQAALRRATSSAYYALFHALCQVSAEGLGLWTSAGHDLELVYRNLDHGRARDVLVSAATRSIHPDLSRIGDVFLQLRNFREDADYSQPGRFGSEKKLLTRSETASFIALAEEAIVTLDGLPGPVRRHLAVLLTVRANRKQR